MRKLIRILAGVVLIGAVLAVNVSPALANHGVGPDPDGEAGPLIDTQKPPDGEGTPNDNTGAPGVDSLGWHEEQPDFAIADVADPCVVTGTVDPGASFTNNSHLVEVPLVNDDPAHSHFEFLNTVINCVGAG